MGPMSSSASIGVGVIGLGFIGRHHVRAYQAAERDGFNCRVIAVCDPQWMGGANAHAAGARGNIEVAGGSERLFDPTQVRVCASVDDLLSDRRVNLVSVCTHTDTHVDLAIRALEAGKHVMVEKPVAIRSAEVKRLADAARGAKALCMPAMCMRFWPGWDWLRERIREGSFGAVRSATFQRLGSRPAWSPFYADESRSGGALFDLHIHDVDFIYWCFGRPRSLCAAGSAMHMTTQYRFDDGPSHVTAEGAWDLTPCAGFRMRYLVTFDYATVEWEIARTPRLVVHRRDESEAIALEELSGYDMEVREFVKSIRDGTPLRAIVEDAVTVTQILEAERHSLQTSAAVSLR
jgi:predicted dehydrogenase